MKHAHVFQPYVAFVPDDIIEIGPWAINPGIIPGWFYRCTLCREPGFVIPEAA